MSNRWRQSVLRKGFLFARSAGLDGLTVTLLKGQSQFRENFCTYRQITASSRAGSSSNPHSLSLGRFFPRWSLFLSNSTFPTFCLCSLWSLSQARDERRSVCKVGVHWCCHYVSYCISRLSSHCILHGEQGELAPDYHQPKAVLHPCREGTSQSPEPWAIG